MSERTVQDQLNDMAKLPNRCPGGPGCMCCWDGCHCGCVYDCPRYRVRCKSLGVMEELKRVNGE